MNSLCSETPNEDTAMTENAMNLTSMNIIYNNRMERELQVSSEHVVVRNRHSILKTKYYKFNLENKIFIKLHYL